MCVWCVCVRVCVCVCVCVLCVSIHYEMEYLCRVCDRSLVNVQCGSIILSEHWIPSNPLNHICLVTAESSDTGIIITQSVWTG